MATGDRLADALVEWVEDFFRVDQTAKAVVASYQDAAVKAIVDAIPGFQHRAVARKHAIRVD